MATRRSVTHSIRAPLAGVVTIALVVGVAACGDDPEPEEGLAEQPAEQPAEEPVEEPIEDAEPVTVDLADDIELPFDVSVVHADVEYRFTDLRISELDPGTAEMADVMDAEDFAFMIEQARQRGDLDGAYLYVPITLVNQHTESVNLSSDSFRLLDTDQLARAPHNYPSTLLSAGAAEELEVVFELADDDLTDLHLQLGDTEEVPTLIELPEGHVVDPGYPMDVTVEADGRIVHPAFVGPTNTIDLDVAVTEVTVGVDLLPELEASWQVGRRVTAGHRYLHVGLEVDNLGGDGLHDDHDGFAPDEAAFQLFIDGVATAPTSAQLSIDQMLLPGNRADLVLVFEVPVDVEEVMLELGVEEPLEVEFVLDDLPRVLGEG